MPPTNGEWEVVVAGAGPAGATAAFLLAGYGLRVLLLDRSDFPRPKLCGGLLTWKTLLCLERTFGITPEALLADGIEHRSARAYRVCDTRGRAWTGMLDEPFRFVDRERYDAHLLRRATAAGVQFVPHARVSGLDFGRGEVVAGARRWKARFVIGADGVRSRVRSSLIREGRLRPARRAGTAAALECRLPDGPSNADPPALYYGFVPWGYAWSFPGPRGRLVGMAALRERAGSRIGRAFRRFRAVVEVEGGSVDRPGAHAIPYGNFLDRPGDANILLVGDAAGLADPFLGEGLFFAHHSAELAARAIVDCIHTPARAEAAYARRCRAGMLGELRLVRAGRNIVFALPPRLYHAVLCSLLRLRPKRVEQAVHGQRPLSALRRGLPG